MYKPLLLCFLLWSCFTTLYAQENKEIHYAYNTFEGTRVVVGHSVEVLKEGEMGFLIAHKFGRINGGAYEFFGLDQAIIRLGLDYAIKDWVMVGIGRSSQDKLADAFIKFRLLRQQSGAKNFPISLTFLTGASYTLLRASNPAEPIPTQDRLAYHYQLLTARQFSDRLSVQVMPTLVHYNLVEEAALSNDVVSIGFAAKYQLNKALSIKSEYYYNLPNQLSLNNQNSLAIGLDINTGSHVFQLHFSNSGGLAESAFIGQTTGKWSAGDIHFGFNLVRVFKLKGRRY